MLRFVTYYCHGMKNSIVDMYELCKHNDLIFCKQIGLFNFKLNIISTIHPDFESYGISAIWDLEEIVQGRPHGGLTILVRTHYRALCEFQTFDDPRLLGVPISSISEKYCFIK